MQGLLQPQRLKRYQHRRRASVDSSKCALKRSQKVQKLSFITAENDTFAASNPQVLWLTGAHRTFEALTHLLSRCCKASEGPYVPFLGSHFSDSANISCSAFPERDVARSGVGLLAHTYCYPPARHECQSAAAHTITSLSTPSRLVQFPAA